MIYTDPAGVEWEVIDFKLGPPPQQVKKRLALGAHDAEGRAFHRADETRIYWFGQVAYRDTSDRTLRNQFKFAKPTTTSPAQQHWGT